MAFFADSEELYRVVGGFLRAQTGTEVTRQIGGTGLCIQFNMTAGKSPPFTEGMRGGNVFERHY